MEYPIGLMPDKEQHQTIVDIEPVGKDEHASLELPINKSKFSFKM